MTSPSKQARVLAWDIYRHWDLWVQSCCPAEEERLREKGREFDDPEEFRHIDEALSSISNQANNFPLLGNQSRKEMGEELRLLEQASRLDDGSCNVAVDPDASPAARRDEGGDYPGSGADLGETGDIAAWRPSRDKVAISASEGERDDCFTPTMAMSARTVVRERRQWALRRARRQEGPNISNQLELGGGMSLADGYGAEGTKGQADIGGNVVALLVGRYVLSLEYVLHRQGAARGQNASMRFG